MPEIIGTSKSISGFDPRSIPGCVLWLDAADASTVTTSGTTVTAIRDKSITGTVLTSPAGFTYPNNTFNGTYPSFYNTNATGGRLGYNSSFSLGSQNTVFIVGQLTSPSAGNQFFDFIDGYTSTNRFFLLSAPNFLNNYVYANNGGVSGQVSGAVTVAQMTSPFCWSVVSDTSTSSTLTSQYVNGTQLVQSTSTIAAISSYTGIIIGQRFTQANESVVGHICEFMIFNNTLSTAQRQQVEGYLAWKWGIEVIPQAPTVPGVSPLNLIPGNPTDIPGCVLWLDAADTQAMTLSGSNVTTWIDKSGLGNNATSYNTPVLTANAINGVQAISTSNLPYFTGSVSVTGTTVTIFSVATTTRLQPNGGNDQRLVSLVNATNVDYGRTDGVIGLFNQYNTSSIATWRVSGPIANNAVVTNTPFLAVSKYDGTNGYLWLNGVAGTRASSASTGTFAVTKYGIGNQANPSGEYWQGFIGEVIIYSNALSDTQRQQVEGYLGRKWGITPLSTSVTSITSTACRVWLDASDTTTLFQNTAGTTAVTADGQSVACWKDKSPNAYTFTQATGANQPTFKTAVMNGQNTLRWNGTSMFLQSSTTLPFFSTTTSGGTFFFVFNASQISSQRFLMHYQNSVSGSYCSDATDIGYTTGATAQGNFGFHRGCGNAVVALKQINQLQANENMLMTGVLGTTGSSPANVQIFKNGRASTVQNDGTGYFSAGSYPSTNNVRYLNIGSRNLYGLGPDAYHYGDIAEIIWFNVALTTAQRQQIESYLSTKWGIPMYGNGYTQLLYSPANVPGCVLWLDAADTTTITGTTTMTAWRDKSSNAYTANSFSNAVAAPSLVSNAPGVGTAVQYSAGNGSSIANFVLKQTMSIFEVYYPINQATGSPFLEHGPDENANSGFYFHSQNNNNFAINSGSGQVAVNSGNVAITNTWQLIEGINPDPSTSSTMAFYVDGQLRASGSTQSGTTTVTRTLFINGRNGANSISYNAYLAELIIFSNALNATQRQAVERYLSFKWGLSNFHTSIPGSVGGLMLWLDGGDPSTMTFPSGSNISAWKDKASLGITVSNLNAGYYPTYVSGLGVYTSNASANCNATNQVLTSTTTWYVPTQNMTLLVSYKLTTSDALREPVYIGGGAGFTARPNFALCPQCGASEGDFMVFDLNSGAWSQNAYSSINTYSGLRIDTLVSIPGASSGFIYVNGIEPSYSILTVPYTSTYTNYPAVVQISGGSLMGNRVFNGYIQEILFYSNVLTTAQRTVVEGYLARKWNNTSIPTEVLPLTHTFSLQRPLARAFNPLDIPDCILWLDGADKTTMTPSNPSSGTSITTWRDKSSNGVFYSSGAVPGQSPYVCAAPTYASTGGLLFNPTVSSTFTNNVTQGLNAVGGYSLNLTGSTLFVVARANGATISYYNSYITWYSSTNGQFFDFDANGSAGYTDVNADSGGLGYNYQTNYTLTNAVTIQCLRLSTTGASTFINGAIAATSTFNSNYTQTANPNSTTVWIGNQAPGARSFSGTIYELLIFNTALSTSQRQQVDGYLGWKWGASLSSSNAFYKFPPSSALPFLPTNITNCALWLDASSPTQFNTFSFASGSNVRIWYDKSGSNNHATASAGAYPTYSYESNCVVWNGTSSSQFVLDTNITNAVVNKGFTIFVVSQRTIGSENFIMRGTTTAVNSNLLIGHGGSTPATTIRFAYYGNDLDYGSVPTYTIGEPPSIISFHYSKPNRAIYYNGVLGSSDTNSSDLASWTGAMVGGGGGLWPAYQGNIFEIIIYGAVLTTAQRQMVEGYLAQKWKI